MSISSAASSYVSDALDPILPRAHDADSISSADASDHPSHSYQHYLHHHNNHHHQDDDEDGKLTHQRTLLSVPDAEDRRASTGSGLTIRPSASGAAPSPAPDRKHRDRDRDSTGTGTASQRSSSSGRSMSHSAPGSASGHHRRGSTSSIPPPLPSPVAPAPAPPPKPSSLRSQPGSHSAGRAQVPAFPARPATADSHPHAQQQELAPQPSSASLGSLGGSTRDRSATVAVAAAAPPPRPGPPTTTPPTQRRRSLTALPLPARAHPQGEHQSHASPPPTPPHHAPSFPLRPSGPPLPGRKPLKRDATGSSGASAGSAASEAGPAAGRPRGRISSRVFAWATSSSAASSSGPAIGTVSAPVQALPPRPGRANPPPQLRRPRAAPAAFSSAEQQQQQQQTQPPPPRHPGAPAAPTATVSGSTSSPPAPPPSMGAYHPSSRGPSPTAGPGLAGGAGAGGAVRAGWGRVQGLWGQGQRRMESLSFSPGLAGLPRVASTGQLPSYGGYGGYGAGGALDAHMPIMPRPLRAPSGRPGQVFGLRLAEAVRRTRSVAAASPTPGPGLPSLPSRESASPGPGADDRTRWLPALVLRSLEHLERWGPEEEGIFRISGMPSHVATLREAFDRGADYDLRAVGPSDLDPHAVAGVFKAFFRELPEPLLTHYLAKRFDEALLPHTGEQVASPDGLSAFGHASSTPLTTTPQLLLDLAHLVRQLPPENRILLRELSRLLKYLARHRETTRMSLTNLLLVICPSVGIASSLVKLFVEEDDVVFGLQEEAGGAMGAREVHVLPSAEGRERELKKKRRETVGSVRTTGSAHSHHTTPAAAAAGAASGSGSGSAPPTPPIAGNANGAGAGSQSAAKRESLPPVIHPPPPSRRNSVQPRLPGPGKIPSVLTSGPSPRRRATSVLAQQQAHLLPISGSAPAPVVPAKPEAAALPGKENRRTPSPPPRLALELPHTPLRIPFDRTSSTDASSPSTPLKRAGFFGELFSKPVAPPKPKALSAAAAAGNGAASAGGAGGAGKEKKRDGPAPRVSIMSKLRPSEDWGSRVLTDAGVPPVPPLPGSDAAGPPADKPKPSAPADVPAPARAVLRKGTVRDKVRNIEDRDREGARTDGEGREPLRGMRRFVRTREKDGLGDGKRGAFFPFN